MWVAGHLWRWWFVGPCKYPDSALFASVVCHPHRIQAVPVLPVSIWAVLYNHMLLPAIPCQTLYSSINTLAQDQALFSKHNDKRSIELCLFVFVFYLIFICSCICVCISPIAKKKKKLNYDGIISIHLCSSVYVCCSAEIIDFTISITTVANSLSNSLLYDNFSLRVFLTDLLKNCLIICL